jgi:hypothetical protein
MKACFSCIFNFLFALLGFDTRKVLIARRSESAISRCSSHNEFLDCIWENEVAKQICFLERDLFSGLAVARGVKKPTIDYDNCTNDFSSM